MTDFRHLVREDATADEKQRAFAVRKTAMRPNLGRGRGGSGGRVAEMQHAPITEFKSGDFSGRGAPTQISDNGGHHSNDNSEIAIGHLVM